MISAVQLQAQHGMLRTAIRHLLDVAVAERGYRAAAPGLLRDLNDALAAHGVDEAAVTYDGLPADAEPCARLEADWRRFASDWTTLRIAADWQGFAAAAQAILQRLLVRVTLEDAWLANAAGTAAPAR